MIYEGFRAYQIYCAVRAHFTSSYDYFKYKGKMKISDEAFLKRNDKFLFIKLQRTFSENKLIQYYVANFINDVTFIRDMKQSNYDQWRKRIENLTYHFTEQIQDLDCNDKILLIEDGQHPPLLRKYMQGKISIETLCILDYVFNFMEYWNKHLTDIIWDEYHTLISNYKPFLSIDEKKFRNIVKKQLTYN